MELVWLDVIALGSIIPPFAGMAFLLLFPLCSALSWTQPGLVLLPIIYCMMVAHTGSFLELRYRVRMNRLLEPVEKEGPALSLEAMVHACARTRAIWHAIFYLAAYALLCALVVFLLNNRIYPVLPALEWPLVYALAVTGAVLSLRERRAYVVCGLCVFGIVCLFTAGEIISGAG